MLSCRPSLNTVKVKLGTHFPVGWHAEWILASSGGLQSKDMDWNTICITLSWWTLLTASSPGDSFPPPFLEMIYSSPQRRSPAAQRRLRHKRPPLPFELHFSSPRTAFVSKILRRCFCSLSALCYDATRRRGLSAFVSLLAGPPPIGWEEVNVREKVKTSKGCLSYALELSNKPRGLWSCSCSHFN